MTAKEEISLKYRKKWLELLKKILFVNVDTEKYAIFLFGSAVDNIVNAKDIDIGIMGEELLPHEIKRDIYYMIDESIVPFKVDIVDFKDVNAEFKKTALKKIEIWNKPKNIFSKLNQLIKAVTGFKKSLDLDVTGLNEVYKDTIKNGNIQKFEICVEILWKTIKKYLEIFYKIDAFSPMQIVKEFYGVKGIDEKIYEELIDMIKDRNLLSHVYNESEFEEVFKKLPEYLKTMINVIDILEQTKQES